VSTSPANWVQKRHLTEYRFVFHSQLIGANRHNEDLQCAEVAGFDLVRTLRQHRRSGPSENQAERLSMTLSRPALTLGATIDQFKVECPITVMDLKHPMQVLFEIFASDFFEHRIWTFIPPLCERSRCSRACAQLRLFYFSGVVIAMRPRRIIQITSQTSRISGIEELEGGASLGAMAMLARHMVRKTRHAAPSCPGSDTGIHFEVAESQGICRFLLYFQ